VRSPQLSPGSPVRTGADFRLQTTLQASSNPSYFAFFFGVAQYFLGVSGKTLPIKKKAERKTCCPSAIE
jgi:hypothetical protein